MKKVEIQEQQLIGWAIVVREDADESWKLLEPVRSLFGCDGDYRFEAEQFDSDDNITGILLTALETYPTTTSSGHVAPLGILRHGDGLSDEYWVPNAEDEVSWQGLACRKVTINNQVEKPVLLFQLSKI